MDNLKNEVLLVLTDEWNDWEASYAVAVINAFSDYQVKTISLDNLPKKSMGGLAVGIDYTIDNYQQFDHLALVILPGGLSWEKQRYDELVKFIVDTRKLAIPLAAICGATTFLCKHGFLNDVKHTGDSLELFKQQKGYQGEPFFIHEQVVVDQYLITANETAAVAFAYEIFKLLAIDSEEEMEEWYANFTYGAVR